MHSARSVTHSMLLKMVSVQVLAIVCMADQNASCDTEDQSACSGVRLLQHNRATKTADTTEETVNESATECTPLCEAYVYEHHNCAGMKRRLTEGWWNFDRDMNDVVSSYKMTKLVAGCKLFLYSEGWAEKVFAQSESADCINIANICKDRDETGRCTEWKYMNDVASSAAVVYPPTQTPCFPSSGRTECWEKRCSTCDIFWKSWCNQPPGSR